MPCVLFYCAIARDAVLNEFPRQAACLASNSMRSHSAQVCTAFEFLTQALPAPGPGESSVMSYAHFRASPTHIHKYPRQLATENSLEPPASTANQYRYLAPVRQN